MKSRFFRIAALASTLTVMACGGGGGGGGGGGSNQVRGVVFVTTLNAPMQYIAMPGQPTIAIVLERSGVLRAVVNDTLLAAPVLDISANVITSGECGLLGIAFDPNFTSNRFFYLHYVSGSPTTTRVVRYTMNPDGISANAGSAHPIFSWPQPAFFNHKGGSLDFGTDGLLYLGLGDGGSRDDPSNNAQNPLQLLGKMLRIDPDSDDFPGDPDNNYSVPAGNPFVGTSGVRGEIWAFGVRNPFRWSIDPISGALLLADVGQDAYEEINYGPNGIGGRNYGWRLREGFHPTSNPGPAFPGPLKDPFIELPDSAARSIIGGFIYRGSALPALQGEYFFADYITDRLWSAEINVLGGEAQPMSLSEATEHTGGILILNGPVSISPDANGEPVVVELNSGSLIRLAPPKP